MLVDHDTREILRTIFIVQARPGDAAWVKSAYVGLSKNYGIEKRTSHSIADAEGSFGQAHIWLGELNGYDSFLALHIYNSLFGDVNDFWDKADAIVVTNSRPGQPVTPLQHLIPKVKAIAQKHPNLKVAYWTDSSFSSTDSSTREAKKNCAALGATNQLIDGSNPNSLVTEILKLLPPITDIAFRPEPPALAAPPDPLEFLVQGEESPSYWVENEMIQCLRKNPAPRSQMLWLEERSDGNKLFKYKSKEELYSHLEANGTEPASFEYLKTSAYQRLYLVGLEQNRRKWQEHFVWLVQASGHAEMLDKIEHDQGGYNFENLLQDYLTLKPPPKPEFALGAVLCWQFTHARFALENLTNSPKKVLLDAVAEMSRWLPENNQTCRDLKEAARIFDKVESLILTSHPPDRSKLRSLYMLALVMHKNPSRAVHAFKQSFENESLIQSESPEEKT